MLKSIKTIKINYLAIFTFGVLFFINFDCQAQKSQKFKIVIDPGHGGELPGARYYGVSEKDIVLKVGIALGEQLLKHDDIEVIYTRKKDINVGLYERAQIANKAKANLFLSIHCNAAENKSATGTETWLLGHSKEAANLEVVKKENAVILLEDNYQEKYKGYNPNSPETFIGINLLQEEYIDQSVFLSSMIQKNYTKNMDLKNRGVKQGPFLVLNQVSMPSILTEIGFISNKTESDYLNSNAGQNEVIKSLYEAIILYKNTYFGGSIKANFEAGRAETKETAQSPEAEISSGKNENLGQEETVSKNTSEHNKPLFKVQVSADQKLMALRPANFKGLRSIDFYKEGNVYKYTYKSTHSLEEAQDFLKEAKKAGFKDAFIITFHQGKKITLQQAQSIMR
jgi:N-acetylmuramoyl-L-alanine amidase